MNVDASSTILPIVMKKKHRRRSVVVRKFVEDQHAKPGLENWWWNEQTEKAVKEKDRLKTRKRTSAENDRN